MYKAIGQWRCRPLHFAEGAEVVLSKFDGGRSYHIHAAAGFRCPNVRPRLLRREFLGDRPPSWLPRRCAASSFSAAIAAFFFMETLQKSRGPFRRRTSLYEVHHKIWPIGDFAVDATPLHAVPNTLAVRSCFSPSNRALRAVRCSCVSKTKSSCPGSAEYASSCAAIRCKCWGGRAGSCAAPRAGTSYRRPPI